MEIEEALGAQGLRTDEGIADILKRLKSSGATKASTVEVQSEPTAQEEATNVVVETPAEAEQVQVAQVAETPEAVQTTTDDSSTMLLKESDILPWFTESDKDLKAIHYITFDQSGNIVYNTAKSDLTTESIAALKVSDDYVCDIDYYKSKHFVMCVSQSPSNYSDGMAFTPSNESAAQTLTKASTETASVADDSRYIHYVVFTDLGIADFLAKLNDAPFPYGESNLSKWFEEISNHTQLRNTKYTPNDRQISDKANAIKDFKYDIITMHRPGVITLDSVDNQDQDYKVNIRLKDEYDFIPLNRILGCLKFYASHTNKTIDDLRRMIDKYFIIM